MVEGSVGMEDQRGTLQGRAIATLATTSLCRDKGLPTFSTTSGFLVPSGVVAPMDTRITYIVENLVNS